MKTIYLDMDGTIADLYGMENWLPKIINEDLDYTKAKPLYNDLLPILKKLSKNYNLGIITWCAKNSTVSYENAVATMKKIWLDKYYPNLFKEVKIVSYGVEKHNLMEDYDILIDDNEKIVKNCYNNRKKAFLAKNNLIKILQELM